MFKDVWGASDGIRCGYPLQSSKDFLPLTTSRRGNFCVKVR